MIQRRAALFACNSYNHNTSVTELLKSLEWPTLKQRRKDKRLTLFYKALNQHAAVNIPEYVQGAPRSVREKVN